MSQCGNFGVVGYFNGMLQKFNLESGEDRGNFGEKGGHVKEVTGVAIDGLNKWLVSASMDGTLKIWDFYRRTLKKTYEASAAVETVVFNHNNDLLGIATSDIRLIVLNTKLGQLRKVREITEVAYNKITDICFSQPDSKHIIAASLDKTIKVFDLLTGHLVDHIVFSQAPLSIDYSPSGEFLASTHVGSKAIFLWASKEFFTGCLVKECHEARKLELPGLES